MSYYIGDKYYFPQDIPKNHYRVFCKNNGIIDVPCENSKFIFYLHREDGPAIINPTNRLINFYINNKKHNNNGAAECYFNNSSTSNPMIINSGYFYHMGEYLGYNLTKEQYNNQLKYLVFK